MSSYFPLSKCFSFAKIIPNKPMYMYKKSSADTKRKINEI